MRWVATLLVVVFLVASVPAQEEAAIAIEAVADVEGAMLEGARERFDTLERRLRDVRGEIELLRNALKAAVNEREAPDYRRVNQLAEQLERAESERSGLLLGERLLLDRIGQHLQRLERFEQEVESLQNQEQEVQGVLSGTWDLVLMPNRQQGTAALQQAGALISGTYELEGGWSGSLQGTLVNRKVFLVRIDSKLGKSMELEGYLSGDGDSIRGSWLNYELAGGQGATGQWTAQRRDETR